VRSQAHQVDGQGLDVDLDLAGGLGRIHVEEHAMLAADRAQGRDVLDHADLVVHEHDRGQDGVGPDGGLEGLQVQQAIGLHVQVGHLEALALQLTHGVQDGLVLGLDRDEVLALVLVEVGRALQRQVVGLGRTAGPDDLARIGADQVRHLLAGLLHRLFRFPPPGMAARRGVAEMLPQPGNHGVHHAGVHRGGGAIVHVDREMRGHVHDESS